MPDDAIVTERQDPEGHDLFREMRVGPLVGLSLGEQLERGACVIHLVEIHVARPVEAVAARYEHRERDERRDRDVAARGNAPGPQTRGEPPRDLPRRDLGQFPPAVGLKTRIATGEPPDQIGRRGNHDDGDGDLTRASEERRLDDLWHAEIDVLLVSGEREIHRYSEGDRERGVRRENPRARRRERERQGEDREEVALVRARRQEVEREAGEHGAGQQHRRIPAPPEREYREKEARGEEQRAVDDQALVRFPEVEEDRPPIERVERGIRIRRRRAAHEGHELGRDPERIRAPERDR